MNATTYFWSSLASARISAALLLRKRRILFLGLLVLLPSLLPVVVAMLRGPRSTATWGLDLYAVVAEYGFLSTLAPLAAILLGTSLVGDDLENGTAPFLLTRAAPRSAIVLGKFAAYIGVTALAFLPAMALTLASVVLTAPSAVDLSQAPALFAQTYSVVVLALVVYGALCCLLGTFTSRPVIYSVMFVFGWEPLTRVVPGYVDFLTLKKHLLALWPVVTVGAVDRSVEVTRKVIDVSVPEASFTLALVVAALIGFTTLTLRQKEFVRGQNLG